MSKAKGKGGISMPDMKSVPSAEKPVEDGLLPYRILWGESSIEVETQVNKLLQQGYQLAGPLCVADSLYQPMIKRSYAALQR